VLRRGPAAREARARAPELGQRQRRRRRPPAGVLRPPDSLGNMIGLDAPAIVVAVPATYCMMG